MAQPEKIGTYQVVSELGRGAMGVVYLCVHPGLGRQVAVKVLSSQVAGEEDFVERFRREGEMAARLRHPNIVQVYDFSNDGDTFFIAMEYLGSQTLKGTTRPLPEALRLLDQLLAALEHAHERGVIHRDLKPSNILVTDKQEIALTDFGIAYSAANHKLTRTGTALGTPDYMAPEQFDGKQDARSDLYSVGIIFYEMLTGFTPFHAESLTEVMKNQVLKTQAPLSEVDFTIPAAISNVVDKVLSKDPNDRYQTAREMREALSLAQMAPLPPPPPSVREATTRVESKPQPPAPEAPRPQRKGAALVLLGLLVVSTLVRIQQRHQNPPDASEDLSATPALSIVIDDDSPTPLSTPTPPPPVLESETPSPPNLALTETPEPVAATPAATQLPEEGMIRPGVGVADLTLGDSTEQVEQRWGAPTSQFEEAGKLHWYYSGPGEEENRFGLTFENAKLAEIDVYSPRFSVENHPDLTMGVLAEEVRAELPNPSKEGGATLDYNDLGIYFYFNGRGARTLPRFGEDGCEDIRVYVPGMSTGPR